MSPVLSNLFMHYVCDVWMKKNNPTLPWSRYADDGLIHCETEHQAQTVLAELKERFKACGLEVHPEKTKIVYCKDDNRKGHYPNTQFEFLGYTFCGRLEKKKGENKFFIGFNPAVSQQAVKTMRAKIRQRGLRNRTDLSLNDIANQYNPILRGWLNYYGHYHRSSMYPVLRHFNRTLVAWAMRKFKPLRGHKTRAVKFVENISKQQPSLFIHWKSGMRGAFA